MSSILTASSTKNPLERCREDFKFFLLQLWRFLGLPDPTIAQYALADELQYGPTRGVTMAFRGMGKSWITAAYCLWLLWNSPQRRIMVVSANADRAVAFSTFCKRVIADWPLLAVLRPNKDGRDSQEAWDVGPAKPHQSPSMKSVGITGQLTGSRATDIIFDDVEVPKNSLTIVMRERLAELVTEGAAVLCSTEDPIADGVTRIRYLGTPQCEDTLYSKLPGRGYAMTVWPARYPERKLIESYEKMGAALHPYLAENLRSGRALPGEPTDPKRFDERDLMEREEEYGLNGFQLQFMLNPSLSDSERYPLKIKNLMVLDVDTELGPQKVVWGNSDDLVVDIECVGLAGDRWLKPIEYSKSGFAPWDGCHMAIDPAGGGVDETVYMITKFLHGYIYLVDFGAYKTRGDDEAVMEEIAEAAKEWGVTQVTIEKNFGDGMYTRLLSPVFKRIVGRGLDPEKVEVNHSGQKELRIIDTLRPILARHKLVITPHVIKKDMEISHPGERSDSAIHRQLFHQLSRMTTEKGALKFDDRVDCLAIACAHWAKRLAKDADEEVKKREERNLRDIVEHRFSEGMPGRENEWLREALKPQSTRSKIKTRQRLSKKRR